MNLAPARRNRISIVGDMGVGKTALATRMVRGEFLKEDIPTIGALFTQYTLNGEMYQLWDTAGEEKYRSLVPLYIRDSTVCIVCIEITDADYKNKLQYWIDSVNECGVQSDRVVICGTKADLMTERGGILGFFHCMTSAMTGEGIEDLGQQIQQVIDSDNARSEDVVNDIVAENEKRNECKC